MFCSDEGCNKRFIQGTEMEEKHRNILRTSNVFLLDSICNVEDICDYLIMDEILDSDMAEGIQANATNKGRIRQMLRILPTRGPKAYESFLSALSKTNHQDCTELLREKEDLTSSQNSVQPKPKDVSGDDPLDHCRQRAPVGIDLSFSGRSQLGMFDIQATTKSWPDLQNGVQVVRRKEIQFTSKEDLTKISENHKTYPMTGKNKGKLIVISNLTEQCKTDCIPGRKRTSSHDVDFDKTSIQLLFRYMKFECKAKAGLQCQTGKELKESLKEIGEDTESSYDSLVVVILSGGMGYEPCQIYDKDGVMLPRDDILQIITDSPAFKGKPKIVIIITYSFEEVTESYDTLDSAKSSSIPNNDDMFVVSTSPMTKMGPWMIGDNGHGSYFIQAFIHVLKNHAHEKSFLQLIEEVDKLLSTAMVPEKIEGKYSDKGTKTHVAKAVVLEYSKEKELFLFPMKEEDPGQQ